MIKDASNTLLGSCGAKACLRNPEKEISKSAQRPARIYYSMPAWLINDNP